MLKKCVFISVLPPVLVPRYSEFPAGHSPPATMPPFQQVPEPTMPHNVTYPNSFRQGPHSPASSGPGSPYGVPGIMNFLFNPFTPVFVNWTLLYMNLGMSIVAKWVLLQNWEQIGKQCWPRWDGSLWAVPSGSTLFGEVFGLVCRAERVKGFIILNMGPL